MTDIAQKSSSIRASLAEIAAQATSLAERLQMGFIPLPTDPAIIEARYRAWQTAVGKDDLTALERRLEWDNFTSEVVRPFLGNVAAPANYELPVWAETLADIIEVGRTVPLDALLASLPSVENVDPTTTAIPFFEFWLPFIQIALTRLAALPIVDCLGDEMRLKLVQWLVYRLQRFGAETLQGMFWKTRLYRRPLLALIGPEGLAKQVLQAQQSPGRDEYLAFVRALLIDPLPFYREHSVMARIFGTIFNQWIDVVEQFSTHLANDLPMLCAMVGLDGDPGQIVNLRMGISDPHHNGQVAFEVEFTQGLHLIYKPHSLQAEAAYQQLLDWLNGYTSNRPDLLPIQTYRVLDRGDYGWAEFVHHQPCEDVNAVARYYQRMGTVICLLHLLNATDLHNENLIAAGEHPIPVDLEMILYPQIRVDVGKDDGEELTLQWLNSSAIQNSVFGSGLIPTLNPGDTVGFDSSGLGNLNMPTAGGNVPVWKYVNTDDMVLVYEDVVFTRNLRPNMPYLGSTPQPTDKFVSELLRGFQAAYRLLLEQREELETRILPMFKAVSLRFVIRPTRVYFNVLLSGIAPEHTTNGAAFSIHLEHLARTYAGAERRPRNWNVCLEEIRTVENLNIPHFSMSADSTALLLDQSRAQDDVFLVDGYQCMLNNLRRFSAFDCQQQSAYIIGALLPVQDSVKTVLPETGTVSLFSKSEFIDEAVRLADLLAQSSYRPNDTVNWVYLSAQNAAHDPTKTSGVTLNHVGNGLYTGLVGIAIFFAGLWRTTGVPEHREWALRALHIPRTLLEGSGRKWLAPEGISAADGIGALVYGLTVCARLLHEPTLIDAAADAATLITADLIAADSRLDVIGGAGGILLSLMALHRQKPDNAVLTIARLCGEHLLDALKPDPISGLCAWTTLDGKFLAGFSHGVAGIALSLLRLGTATGDQRYIAAAEEAIAYEDTLYSPIHHNWRDLRQDEEAYITSWCHGAPGIALARLGGLATLDNGAVRCDLKHGLEATQNVLSAYPHYIDHLCCGNFGRIDILLEAGRRLDRPELVKQAEQTAANVVALARQTGAYSLMSGQPRGVLNPGLFNGCAGIGYALLRLAQPDLPCVLLWD